MIESFRKEFGFCQYISNKPAKHNMKIFSVVDSGNFYTLNIEIYSRQQK